MQNSPPNPQQNPPSYQPPFSQPLPPNAPPFSSNTQPIPPTQPPFSSNTQPIPPTQPPFSSNTQPIPPTQPPYPPYPPYSQPLPPSAPPYPPYPPQPYPVYMPQLQAQDNTTALVLEAVCAVFGLYGIGWLFRGRVAMGIGLLALGFAWVGFVFFVTLFTAGFGLLCLGPLHLLLIVGDVLMLNSSLRQR